MEVAQLQKQFLDFMTTVLREGFVNEQLIQLHQLDETNPDLALEIITLFLQDTENLLGTLDRDMNQQPLDFNKIGEQVHQLKGSSSSIGAQRVTSACMTFRSCCQENNLEGCQRCFQEVKHEYSLVKSKLESLLGLEQQILAAGGKIPIMRP